MSQEQSAYRPRWYVIPPRVLLVTFVVTLLSFAVSLLLGILGVLIVAAIRGVHGNMALAYRDVAFPVGVAVGVIALISSSVMEVRRYRQTKALGQIAEHMHAAR